MNRILRPSARAVRQVLPVPRHVLAAALLSALMAACGGGHDDGGTAAPVLGGTPGSGTSTGTSGTTPPDASSSAPATGGVGGTPATGSSATHASFTIDAVDWLEPVLTPAAASRPLVAGRPVTLRVRLHGKAALPVSVGVSVYDANGALLNGGPKSMSGPATAPASEPSVTDSAYQYAMDPTWMRAGVRIDVQVDPQHRYVLDDPSAARATVTPPVVRGQVMRLSVVPVVIAGTQALLPEDDDVRQALMAAYPLSDIVITRHAPYTSTTVTEALTADNEDTLDAWGKLLGEIAALRKLEGVRGQHYYGFIPKHDYWGTVGIGYEPGSTAVGRAPWTVGETGWGGTLRHESGHNFDRPHSPCGVSGDSAYPYTGATLGTTWGYDRRTGKFLDPSATKDFMSYCSPGWVSDWTYDHVQSYFDQNPLDDLRTALSTQGQRASLDAAPAPTTAASDLLLVQGSVAGGSVQLQAPIPFRGAPDADQGTHRLVVRFADGSSATTHFTPETLDHASGRAQFAVAVPARGAVSAVEVYRGGSLIHQRAFAGGVSAATAKALHASPATAQRDRDGWSLRWAAGPQARATITHVAGARRTVLAIGVSGGSWHVPASAVSEATGAFEIGIGDDGAVHLETRPLDSAAATTH